MEKKNSSIVFSLNARMNFKIIVVGSKSVGKTSLILREVKQTFHENYKITVGVEFYSKVIFDEQDQIALQIWDSAGQEHYKSVVKSFYALSNCVILVYDKPTCLKSEVEKWLEQILEQVSVSTRIILVRTKIDLLPINEDEQKLVQNLREKYRIEIFKGVSSKEGTNVSELFMEIAKLMKYLFDNDFQFREKIDQSLKSLTTSSNTISLAKNSRSRRINQSNKLNCCK